MLAEGSIMGVNLGDELCWSCLPYSNLTAAVNLVRRDLPRGTAILYYNEAYPVLSEEFCQTPAGHAKLGYPRVPEGLDWISIDYCEPAASANAVCCLEFLQVRERSIPTRCCSTDPGDGTIAGAPEFYKEHLYPKMALHQHALYVPPAFSSGYNRSNEIDSICCPANTHNPADPGPNPDCNGNCTQAMVQWAAGAYDWARTDDRLVGLAPWHYYSTAAIGGGVPVKSISCC
jgi:hypothetical protein